MPQQRRHLPSEDRCFDSAPFRRRRKRSLPRRKCRSCWDKRVGHRLNRRRAKKGTSKRERQRAADPICKPRGDVLFLYFSQASRAFRCSLFAPLDDTPELQAPRLRRSAVCCPRASYKIPPPPEFCMAQISVESADAFFGSRQTKLRILYNSVCRAGYLRRALLIGGGVFFSAFWGRRVDALLVFCSKTSLFECRPLTVDCSADNYRSERTKKWLSVDTALFDKFGIPERMRQKIFADNFLCFIGKNNMPVKRFIPLSDETACGHRILKNNLHFA